MGTVERLLYDSNCPEQGQDRKEEYTRIVGEAIEEKDGVRDIRWSFDRACSVV